MQFHWTLLRCVYFWLDHKPIHESSFFKPKLKFPLCNFTRSVLWSEANTYVGFTFNTCWMRWISTRGFKNEAFIIHINVCRRFWLRNVHPECNASYTSGLRWRNESCVEKRDGEVYTSQMNSYIYVFISCVQVRDRNVFTQNHKSFAFINSENLSVSPSLRFQVKTCCEIWRLSLSTGLSM